MGQVISALRVSVKEADRGAEEKAKQDLDILQTLVDSKLDQFQAEVNAQVNERFLNPDVTAKTQVPGIRALRWERRSLTNIDKPAELGDGAVDDFFHAGSNNSAKAVKDGFKGVIKTALNDFLGNVRIGEESEEKFFIYMVHNTIVRVNVKLWRWNFAGEGVSNKYKSVLGYVIEYAGDDDENVNKYVDAMQKTYSAARKMKQSNKDD